MSVSVSVRFPLQHYGYIERSYYQYLSIRPRTLVVSNYFELNQFGLKDYTHSG